MIVKASNRDWTEDFERENGNYTCKCARCKETFNGHKRRVLCKVCDKQLAQPFPDFTEAVEDLKREIYTSPLVQRVLHFFERII